jgi:hypothetical protein
VARVVPALFPADAPLADEMVSMTTRLRTLQDPEEGMSQAVQWARSKITIRLIALGCHWQV